MSKDTKQNISTALQSFSKGNLFDNAIKLFNSLGYITERQAPLPQPTFDEFKDSFIDGKKFDKTKAKAEEWKYVDLLFQLSKEEVLKQATLFDTKKVNNTVIETYLFFVIELTKDQYSRTELSLITREVNRLFPMPVMILFRHGNALTLSVINRRLHKRDEGKDVLEKVTQIKDINIENPHRAHIEILFDLSFDELKRKENFTNFVELHNAWQKTLDTKELNKRFYEELFKWYLWAVKNVEFPQIRPKEDLIPDEAHQSESVIRLLTRLLFCWFMKEKQQLIPEFLFDKNEAKKILNNFNPDKKNSAVYYRAVLQNLFFATLSVPVKDRKYIRESFKGNNNEYGYQYVFRYQDEFANSKDNLKLFKDIPFLNGGLFDSLDKRKDDDNTEEIRLDGFSSATKKQAFVPDFIFWDEHKHIDLSKEFDNPRRNNETVKGIFEILNAYKFTIEENTPLEEEIALDPDLLGRTFENLLASYNPETKSNARKQTGSFYTPREIVNYMVDESLLTYFKQQIVSSSSPKVKDEEENKLRNLLSYSNAEIDFSEAEKEELIHAIDNIKILDPACGSGAFPMGILHKLVHILNKIDPKNEKWFESLINRMPDFTQAEMRNKLAGENWNYLRKLGLIQQSIYGVDIQPIAIQIAKLRFFISLIVDQKIKDTPENNFGLLPLPNLDFKLVCANTLIAAPEEESGGSIQFADKFAEKFKQESGKYFSVSNPKEKKTVTDKIKTLVNEKVAEKIKEIESHSKHIDERYSKIVAAKNKDLIEEKKRDAKLWHSYNNMFKHESVGFFEPKYFFPEVNEGFDIVISNPPYGAKFTASEKLYFKSAYKHQDYQPESFLFFTEKSFDFLKNNGVLSFIIPNTWLTNLKLVKIRKFLTGNNVIQNISHYHKSVFDAVVDTEVVIFKKGFVANNTVKIFNHIDAEQLQKLKHNQNSWKEKNGDVINIFTNPKIEKLVEKLKSDSEVLSFYCDLYSGVKPYEIGKGSPPQTKEILKNRIYDSTSKINSSYKKVLRGSDINKFQNNWNGERWIKYGDNLAAPRKSAIFSQPKIVIRQTGDSLIATFDEEGFICLNNTHVINQKLKVDLKYILALINSTLLNFYFQYLNPETGEALAEVKKETVEKLLIKKAKDQKPFITLVDKILSAKEINPDADTTKLEKQLDEMVYKLYELTEEEIKIVEGK